MSQLYLWTEFMIDSAGGVFARVGNFAAGSDQEALELAGALLRHRPTNFQLVVQAMTVTSTGGTSLGAPIVAANPTPGAAPAANTLTATVAS